MLTHGPNIMRHWRALTMPAHNAITVLPGQQFDRLTVIREVEKAGLHDKKRQIECQCTCGNVGVHGLAELRKGTTKSCGCLALETVPIMERLMAFVIPEPNSGCLLWTGALNRAGYGSIGRGRAGEGVALAHRVTYEHFVGPIPEELELDHLCRVRSCCNFRHLEPVTHAENVRRGIGSGPANLASPMNKPQLFCRKGHPMEDGNLYYWGTTKRRRKCLICFNEWRAKNGLNPVSPTPANPAFPG